MDFLLEISFTVYVPESFNELNFEVKDTYLVSEVNFTAAKKKFLDYMKGIYEIEGNKILENTVEYKNKTLRSLF